MEEDKKSMDIKILSIFFILIQIIVISLFLMFFIGISKVDALTSSASNWYVNGNKCITNDWNGVGTLSCINNANSNRDYTLRTNANMPMIPGKKYTFMYKATVTANFGTANSWTSNITNMYVSYNRNGTLGDVTSCEHTYSSTNYNDKKVYTIQATCKDVQFSQNTDGFVIRVYFHNTQPVSGNGMVAKISQIYLEETGTDNSDITNTIDNSTTEIINNNNNNTQAIINANGAIGESINNTINGMKESIIESGKTCEDIDKVNIKIDNKWLNYLGNENNSNYYGITDYININKANIEIISTWNTGNSGASVCYYNVNKELISCQNLYNLTNLTIPGNAYYMRSSILKSSNIPTYRVCKNGNQSIFDKIGELYDIDNWIHEDADIDAIEDVEDIEGDLDSYLTDPVDIEDLDYEIDTTTNTTIWGIFDRIVTGNSTFLTTFLSILFCGILKLVLAR